MKKPRIYSCRDHPIRRRNKILALTLSVETLLKTIHQWRIVSDKASDELTLAVLSVERSLERME